MITDQTILKELSEQKVYVLRELCELIDDEEC
jgi:hypothetical protein